METTLKVEGMNCGAYVNHVTRALQEVASVQHDENTDAAALVEAVAEAVYQAHRVCNANETA